jgi:hypothetical protein
MAQMLVPTAAAGAPALPPELLLHGALALLCAVLLRAMSPERLLHCLSLLVSKLLRLTVRRLQGGQVVNRSTGTG